MATEVLAAGLGEMRAASTASGGSALTNAVGGTTAASSGFIQLPLVSSHIFITPRNFATAVVVKVLLNPWLVVLKTTDNMITKPTDYSNAAQDADATTDIDVSELSTLANGDFLLVGSHLPIRGAYIAVGTTNSAGTAALDVFYWGGSVWVDASDTDNTFSTRVFAQSGLVTWTVPTPWPTATIRNLYPSMTAETYYRDVPLYWTRWSVDAALTDTTVSFDSMVAANRSTAYAELVSGQTLEERIQHGLGGIGCVEALTDAGTANLIVNVATQRGGRFA